MDTSKDAYYRSLLAEGRAFRRTLDNLENDELNQRRFSREVEAWLRGIASYGSQLTDRNDRERFQTLLDLWRSLLDTHLPIPVRIPPLVSSGPLIGVTAPEFAREVYQARREGTEISNLLLSAPQGEERIALRDFDIDLTSLRMPNCRFERVDFRELRFTDSTVFTSCSFVDCNFSGVSAVSTVFSDSDLERVDFSHADLSYVNFSRSAFRSTRFEMTNLTHAQFLAVILSRIEFIGAGDEATSMRGVQIVNAVAPQLVCKDIDMHNAVLSGTKFVSVLGLPSPPRFENCDLTDAYFIDTDLLNAGFRRCKVRGTAFPRSRLEGADMNGVELNAVDLTVSLRENLHTLKTAPHVVETESVVRLHHDA